MVCAVTSIPSNSMLRCVAARDRCSRYDASKGGPCGYKPGSFDAEEKERRRLEREYRKQSIWNPDTETASEYAQRLSQWLKDNNY